MIPRTAAEILRDDYGNSHADHANAAFDAAEEARAAREKQAAREAARLKWESAKAEQATLGALCVALDSLLREKNKAWSAARAANDVAFAEYMRTFDAAEETIQ